MDGWLLSLGVPASRVVAVVEAADAAGFSDPDELMQLDRSDQAEFFDALSAAGVVLGDRNKIKKAVAGGADAAAGARDRSPSPAAASVQRRKPPRKTSRSPSAPPQLPPDGPTEVQYRTAFDEVDMDQSGTINTFELGMALGRFGLDGSKARDMITAADLDGDAELDFESS
eukprot:SAG22_NODE_842_length_6892_cov_10.369645_1_plen_171_part_00